MPASDLIEPGWTSQTLHYENFPVASVLVPRALRAPIAAVYRFARYGDDVADEGHVDAASRLAELEHLAEAVRGRATHPVVEPLRVHMERHRIAPELLTDLLSAFSQDAAGYRFADRADLLDYCRRSADPIGRIFLRIFDADKPATLAPSDAICSALQLINFAQDIGQDTTRGRCYVAATELRDAGVDDAMLRDCVARGRCNEPVRAMIDGQVEQAVTLLRAGLPLLPAVPVRLRMELAAIIAGGRLTAARVVAEDPIASRIKLGRRDAPRLLSRWLGISILHRLP